MIRTHEEYQSKLKEFRRCDGSKILQSLDSVRMSYLCLYGNFVDLADFLRAIREDPRRRIQLLRDFFQEEQRFEQVTKFYRHLSNLTFSMSALRDHTRHAYCHLLDNHPALAEYQAEAKSVFENCGEARFLQGLRNYFAHKSNDGISYHFKMDGSGLKIRFVLCRDQLLKSSEWKNAARVYLESQSPEFGIESPLETYSALVEKFYGWLETKHFEWFPRELEEHGRLLSPIVEYQNKIQRQTTR